MIKQLNYKKASLIAAIYGFMAALLAEAQRIIYPLKGQSNDQLSKDRYECHLWAVQVKSLRSVRRLTACVADLGISIKKTLPPNESNVARSDVLTKRLRLI